MKPTTEFWAIPKYILADERLSIEAVMIYGILFTRANGESEAWPSQKRLAGELRLGVRTIQRHIDRLEEAGYIEKIRKGKRMTNRYVIRQIDASLVGGDATAVTHSDATAVTHPVVKEQKEKNKGIHAPKKIGAGAIASSIEIAEGIDLFKSVNPSYKILFGRNPQRDAMARMIMQQGFEKVKTMILFLPKNNKKAYAPKITTPIQLEAKMGELIAFWAQEKDKLTSKPTGDAWL